MNVQIRFGRETGRAVDCRDFRTRGSDGLRSTQAAVEAAVEGACAALLADRIEALEGRTEDNQLGYGVSRWPSSKASRVYRARLPIGWSPKARTGSSHIILQKAGYTDFVSAFHDRVEIGPNLLTRISEPTAVGGG